MDQNKTSHGRIRHLGILAMLVGVCGAAGASISAAGDVAPDAGATPDASYASSHRGVVRAVQHELTEGFRVFARARTKRDQMSAQAEQQVGNSVRSGRNVALSRAIETTTGQGWAVPGNGALCVVVPDPVDGYGVSCSNTEAAMNRGAVVMLVAPETPGVVRLTMVSPRGSVVDAVMDDGRTKVLKADQDGVVSAALVGVRRVQVKTLRGQSSLTMPTPPPVPPGR